MSCEDQALVPTDRCLKWGCERALLVKRGRFWVCPQCGNSYGAHPSQTIGLKPIKTPADYHAALDEILDLLIENSDEYDERLAILFQLVAGWETLQKVVSLDGPSVNLDLESFAPCGPGEDDGGRGSDLDGRRLGTLTINGVPHHVEAFAVARTIGGEQIADGSPVLQEWFEQASQAAAPDGPFQTVRSDDGRTWALFISPYC